MCVGLTALACAPTARAQSCQYAPELLPVDSFPSFVAAADFNKDGWIDLVSANRAAHSVSFLLNTGTGEFEPSQTVRLGLEMGPRWVHAVDIDGDTNIDIITANRLDGSISILLNEGGASFQTLITVQVGPQPTGVISADVDGDGDPDILVCGFAFPNSRVYMLRNLGRDGETWLGLDTPMISLVQSGTRSIMAADIDLDGDIDVMTADRDSGLVSMLLNDGTGELSTIQGIYIGGGPRDLVAGDFNGDNMVDIAVVEFHAAQVAILLNLGRDDTNWRGFAAPIHIANIGFSPHGITAGDLDLDGDLDLTVADVRTRLAIILRNDGNANFDIISLDTGFPGAASVINTDVDLDGDLDFVFAIAQTQDPYVSVVRSKIDPQYECIADFDRDGAVNTIDVVRFLNVYARSDWCGDLNQDGTINTLDVLFFLSAFSQGCP